AAMRADAGALAAGDARIDRERRVLAGHREIDRGIGIDIPGMVEIEIGKFRRHQRRVGQTVARVLAGRAGDVERRVHRTADAGLTKIAGRRIALALADVDGDAKVAILLELQALDLALAHVHRETAAGADTDLRLA